MSSLTFQLSFMILFCYTLVVAMMARQEFQMDLKPACTIMLHMGQYSLKCQAGSFTWFKLGRPYHKALVPTPIYIALTNKANNLLAETSQSATFTYEQRISHVETNDSLACTNYRK